MSERRDVSVHVPYPARGFAEAKPPTPDVKLVLVASRLTLLGVLVTVGLGVAGFVLTAGVDWWHSLAVGFVTFAATVALLQGRKTEDLLARFAEWVLPGVGRG